MRIQESLTFAAPQNVGQCHEHDRLSETELGRRTSNLEAQVGRLIAEAGSLEDENAWLNAQLKETQSDKWYLEIAKSGLEDRVAHLAAALVQA